MQVSERPKTALICDPIGNSSFCGIEREFRFDAWWTRGEGTTQAPAGPFGTLVLPPWLGTCGGSIAPVGLTSREAFEQAFSVGVL